MMTDNILDIIKRLDIQQNVLIRIMDEATGEVIQEHSGHNAATNSLLTGIAHYLMGEGVLNQGKDTLSLWVPQYISLGTMGLTSQESEELEDGSIVPRDLGYTPVAPDDATGSEKYLNDKLRFMEYINQTPGFGADGYDDNSNNNREWFGLGYPYSLKPSAIKQDFYTWDGTATSFTLSTTPTSIVSVTLYPDGEVNQDTSDTEVERIVLPDNTYSISGDSINLDAYVTPSGTRVAVIYTYDSKDAANCELVMAKIDKYNNIVPLTERSGITYRDMVPEFNSEIPNTLDVVYSAMISTGALKEYRGDRDYIYITEVGLWSNSTYNDSGDNGLLAGYRIVPSNFDVGEDGVEQQFTGDGTRVSFVLNQTALDIISVTINGTEVINYALDKPNNTLIFATAPASGANIIVLYKTTYSWMDVGIKSNREAIQKSIIRLGVNQVAQIVWKLQLGGLEQLNGLRSLYEAQHQKEVWTIV